MPDDGRPLRHHLLDLLFGLFEGGAVLLALDAFFPVTPGLVLIAVLLFCGAALLWLGARVPRRVTESGTGRGVRALLLRVALLCLFALLLGLVGVLRFGLPGRAVLLLLWTAAIATPLLDAFRVLLGNAERDAGPEDDDPLGPLCASFHEQLVLCALGTGAPAMAAAVGFAAFFVPLSAAQILDILTAFPPIAILLMAAWLLWLRRAVRPIRRYLKAGLDAAPGPVPGPGHDPAQADAAYRAAQLLPYQLGASKVLLWLLSVAALGVLGNRLWGIDLESAALILGETLVITLGAALYEVLWHRSILAPLLTELAVRRHGGMRNPLSLRTKMLIAFGTLTLFACGLSLFWSVMQYKTVATRYTERLARQRLLDLTTDLARRPPADEAALAQRLRNRARRDMALYYLPAGDPGPARGFAGGSLAAPPLPGAALQALRSGREGVLELPAGRLFCSYGPISLPPSIGRGSVLIAQPGYRGGEIDTETRVLIGFFVVLLLVSLGVVVLAAADLTRPIRQLERRAEAIAHGDLSPPRSPVAVENDEVGRLCAAFESMRQALSERFRSSSEINVALEAQVARRTVELERRNRELKEALEALTRAQEDLLQAEKMASMGRLVAGIAHEINNPVNAVVNTAGPLQESLAELGERVQGEAQDEQLGAELLAAVADMRDMLRVIGRGARRTKEIVQALHNYSRGDEGQRAQVDLHRCLDDSLDLLGHVLRGRIAVRREYDPGLRPVMGHAGQLQQVFMNLLTNAVQALSDREGGELVLRTFQEGTRVGVAIADNGPGIPPEALPRIFDPFFTTKEVGQGSGLGLSIVHGIVARHGGAIEVESEVGRGTRLTVTLPAAQRGE
jgi:signal transduction histidine kinase